MSDAAKFLKNIGYNFESLAEEYFRLFGYSSELERRLKLIDEWDGKVCLCSAMGGVVPYLYCLTVYGEERLPSIEECRCCYCSKAPCEHFYDPNWDSFNCPDFELKEGKPSPCAYVRPTDEEIEKALKLGNRVRRCKR